MIYHIDLSVRAALHWSEDEWQERVTIFSDEDGQPLTVYQAKEFLMDELKRGHELLPVGDCDNFDFEHGCQGHEEQNNDKN